MARIRTIKPEFWTAEQIMECSPNARLLFIGMWNFCDDAGIHPASCKTLKAEVFPSDDITASEIGTLVAELEGQEPAAWMTANREMTSFVNFHDDDLPLYARPVPAEPVNARLLAVATGKIPHLYDGRCPDYVDGLESRDPDCPACQAIAAADAQQERLLQDMHDAGREIDRVMAEPAPKAVRLTDEEVDICFDGSDGTRIGAARAIETAVLRKNGIEVAE